MDESSRRSTAAQFFTEEDEEPKVVVPVYDKVVELINQASLLVKDAQKVNNLKQVQELIIHKDPNLLDNFFDEMIAFQSDRSTEVRKYVISFMEEACKKDQDLLTKIMPCLQLLLQDENINVQKKVILTLSSIYRTLIMWLNKSKAKSQEKSQVWDIMAQMKKMLYDMMDSENDGIRTHSVKFTEGIVLTLSWKTPESEIPKNLKPENDVSLGSLLETSPYLKVKKLEDEGRKMFEALLQFQGSPHISSINLMTVMGSLTNIAKQRPGYYHNVVQAFETLHVNLPPTLAKSQVSSVRKNLKMQMLTLLKHPCAVDHLSSITTLLTDLGATQSEVMKSMPKVDESKKRKSETVSAPSKKQKLEKEEEPEPDDDDNDIGMTPWADRQTGRKLDNVKLRQTAIDITSEDLVPRLSVHNVADLVLISMVMLPETMPAHFQATYTPIAAAGTEHQISHVSRLLATQLTMAGMGKGIAEIQRQAAEKAGEEDMTVETPFQAASPKQLIQTVVGGYTMQEAVKKTEPTFVPPTGHVRRGIKHFKLSNVTEQMDRDSLDKMTLQALERILSADKSAAIGNALPARTKLLASLVSQFGGELKPLLQDFIFEDLRGRADLAFSWLYQEYANCMGFSSVTLEGEKTTMASYDECLTRLLNGLLEKSDHKEGLFHRLILEAPCITDNSMQILKRYCSDEARVLSGLGTLKTLIITRPAHRLRFLEMLLEFTCSDLHELRIQAITFAKDLYETPQAHDSIEKFAILMLKNLLLPKPSPEMFIKLRGRQVEPPETWTEDTIKMCLFLYLGLLPINHKLIHELGAVYTVTAADIKRTILRMLETPVKGMGMHSPELLLFVENCPKGAETLVTRVIHILTDKCAPSPGLVERVRDLYLKRVPDVRFLIPVLTGLAKKEVIGALPKLIKLNPVVVKEVFNRLLGGHAEAGYQSPLTPAELLVSLHNLDDKVDMKTTIKATNLCFGEKKVYTQEVLALVMQQLMEQSPLPTLFMRTVLQSLSTYPRLLGLVLNILQRLLHKQVWKQKKVWEGFIRCCQKTKPQSFQVLLQVPANQLKSVFEICPDLREPLLNHVNSFTPHQRAHVPRTVINILEMDPTVELREREQRERVEAMAREAQAAQDEAKRQQEKKVEEEQARLKKEAEDRLREKKAEEERLLKKQELAAKIEEEKRRAEQKKLELEQQEEKELELKRVDEERRAELRKLERQKSAKDQGELWNKERPVSKDSGAASSSRESRSDNRESRSDNRESRSDTRESRSDNNRESRSDTRESHSDNRDSRGDSSRESRSDNRESRSDNSRESRSDSRREGRGDNSRSTVVKEEIIDPSDPMYQAKPVKLERDRPSTSSRSDRTRSQASQQDRSDSSRKRDGRIKVESMEVDASQGQEESVDMDTTEKEGSDSSKTRRRREPARRSPSEQDGEKSRSSRRR